MTSPFLVCGARAAMRLPRAYASNPNTDPIIPLFPSSPRPLPAQPYPNPRPPPAAALRFPLTTQNRFALYKLILIE